MAIDYNDQIVLCHEVIVFYMKYFLFVLFGINPESGVVHSGGEAKQHLANKCMNEDHTNEC